jgi:hypothetical protein
MHLSDARAAPMSRASPHRCIVAGAWCGVPTVTRTLPFLNRPLGNCILVLLVQRCNHLLSLSLLLLFPPPQLVLTRNEVNSSTRLAHCMFQPCPTRACPDDGKYAASLSAQRDESDACRRICGLTKAFRSYSCWDSGPDVMACVVHMRRFLVNVPRPYYLTAIPSYPHSPHGSTEGSSR